MEWKFLTAYSGTALFVSIGQGLEKGGPASLFLAYFIASCMLAMVNNSIAEMSVAYPVSGGFIRLAGKWVDDALGFMAGWNFLLVIHRSCRLNSDFACADCLCLASMKLYLSHSKSLHSILSSRSGAIRLRIPAQQLASVLVSSCAMREPPRAPFLSLECPEHPSCIHFMPERLLCLQPQRL